MNSNKLWNEFCRTGRVEQYLIYAESKRNKAVKSHGTDENKRSDNKDC